jgi:hypothetical protein
MAEEETADRDLLRVRQVASQACGSIERSAQKISIFERGRDDGYRASR